jgi:8-oxo-dGTP pyrophosphatase MutT (NUDIX family)
MSGPRKACPVILRRTAARIEVLAFRHPLAGYQLVKGTIEPAETIQDAAERELLEESGIIGAAIDYLGTAQMIEPDQEWHFVVVGWDSWLRRGRTGRPTVEVWILSSFGIQ